MKNKKGFIATSMIYAFFLVFLMLMVTILANSINNRILVGRIKEDIRSEINAEASFAVDVLPSKNYAVSEVVRFAGEDWNVITDKGSTVVLVLNRALNKQEIVSAIREEGNNRIYGTCNDTDCQVRACFNASNTQTAGEQYCWYYSGSSYRIPAWNPTSSQINNSNVTLRQGQTIVSSVVRSWFDTHQSLQRVLSKGKLVSMTFNDGGSTVSGYVRIPSTSEISGKPAWTNVKGPFHVLERASNTQTRIYGTSLQTVNSNTSAFIRPVIEVYKEENTATRLTNNSYSFTNSNELTNNFSLEKDNSITFINTTNGTVRFYTSHFDYFPVLKLKKFTDIRYLTFDLNIKKIQDSPTPGCYFKIPYIRFIFTNNRSIYVYPIHNYSCPGFTYESYLPVPSKTEGYIIINEMNGDKKRINKSISENKWYTYLIEIYDNNIMKIDLLGYSDYVYTYNLNGAKLKEIIFHPTNAWWGDGNEAYLDNVYLRYA